MSPSRRTPRPSASGSIRPPSAGTRLLSELETIERSGGDGTIRLAARTSLRVSSLDKVWFPEDGVTKGDVMRYYARVAPYILPALVDRPLVLKRSPEGASGETFFQQRPPERAPSAVRVEAVETEAGDQERTIGGGLATLLYLVQIGCISMDPWHSRLQSLDEPDYTILDLDPGPRAPFARVVEVALAVKEELDALALRGAPKTSGSRGIHIVLPLPRGLTYDDALRLAQLVATRVAERRPRAATVERAVGERAPGAVYVDYLQNVRGKSVAAAYCVRAKPGATVSTPLEWAELDGALDRSAFTIETVPARIAELGDLWRASMRRRNPIGAVRAALGERRPAKRSQRAR
jgi:bifunctional non-homologous end joining protein LigD